VKRGVLWSRDALDDLKAQLVHISKDSPGAARRVVERIRSSAGGLGDFATGRPGRVTGTYEKPVGGPPYVIAYTLTEHRGREAVVILRVIHAARDWRDDEGSAAVTPPGRARAPREERASRDRPLRSPLNSAVLAEEPGVVSRWRR
jgi:toxin ParE1/3/4